MVSAGVVVPLNIFITLEFTSRVVEDTTLNWNPHCFTEWRSFKFYIL